MNQSEKLHFKMYKAGRRWLVAAVAGVGVAVGIGTANALPVSADTTAPQVTTEQSSQADVTSQSQASTTPAAQSTTDRATQLATTENNDADTTAPDSASAASSTASQAPASDLTDTKASEATDTSATQTLSRQVVAAEPIANSSRIAVPGSTAPVAYGMGDLSITIGTGKNDQATATSSGNSNAAPDVKSATTTIDARNADNVTVSFTVGNSTSSALHVHPVIMLPTFPYPGSTNSQWVVDASKVDESTFTSTLPVGLTLSYSMVGNNGQYLTYAEMMQQHPNFTWDKLQAIMIDGAMSEGSTYTVNLPLVWIGKQAGSEAPLTTIPVHAYNFESPAYTYSDDLVAQATPVKLTHGTATSTRTINFVDADGNQLHAPVVQAITYRTVKNETTGQTVYTPQGAGAYDQFTVPPKAGYTANQTSVARQAIGASTTAPQNPIVTVTYTPILTYGTASSTRTINLVDLSGKVLHAPIQQIVTYKTVTNEATGQTVYTPNNEGAYDQFTVPPETGYTANQTTVVQQGIGASTTAPKNTSVTVTYTPILTYGTASSTRTINLVDVNGKALREPIQQTVTYKTVTNEATGQTVYTPNKDGAYNQFTVPSEAGYTADQNTVAQQAIGASTTAPENTSVTVTYTPILTYGTASSTRTINLVDVSGKELHDPIQQTVTYKTVTNEATGQTVYTPQGGYAQFTVPTEAGYTASQAVVAQEVFGVSTTAPTNTSVTVTYTPQLTYGTATSTRTIHLVDVNGKVLRDPIKQTVTYKTVTNEATGQTVYTPQGTYEQFTVPSEHGYTANQTTVAQQALGASTTAPTNTSVTVTYTPILTDGTATSSRTIYFVDANGNQLHAPVVQAITYKTVTNQATGVTTYTPQGVYDEVVAPAVAGYTAQQQTVAQQAVGVSDVVPASTEITIRYIKNAPAGNGGGTSTGTPGGTTTGTTTGTGEGRPTLPDTDASDDSTATSPEAGTEAGGKTQTSGLKSGNIADATNSAAKSKRPKLPDTGNVTSGAIALAGAALMTLLGLGELRRTRQ